MRTLLAKAVFESWPFAFGHVSLMNALKPPSLPEGDQTITLRRYGVRIQYDPTSYIGMYLHYGRLFEGQILRSIEAHLHPGGTFVDIGANIGQHTLVAATLVGAHGRVISFEPGAKQRARLMRNIEINGLKNVDVRPYGLSRQAGLHELFNINSLNDGQSTLAKPDKDKDYPSEIVQLRTLDEQAADVSSCVVKIDVEGAEMEVLQGAEGFIARTRPVMFIECIDEYLRRFGSSSAALFDFLHDRRYQLLSLKRVGFRKLWAPVARPVDCDLMAIPR